jgi:predicted dehydrogenase
MVDACAGGGVVLQVGFNQRFWGQVQIAKALLDAGFIGKVHQMRSIYSEKSTAYPAVTNYRYDLAQSGGATIIDLTIHRIDLARHLDSSRKARAATRRGRAKPRDFGIASYNPNIGL